MTDAWRSWPRVTPDAVDALVEWCRHGPPNARIDTVETLDEEPEGLVRFAVR